MNDDRQSSERPRGGVTLDRLMRGTLLREQGPDRDLARGVMRHLRVRHVAIINVNEMLESVAMVFRAIAGAVNPRRND